MIKLPQKVKGRGNTRITYYLGRCGIEGKEGVCVV